MNIVLKGLPLGWSSFISMFGVDLTRSPKPTFSNLIERLQSEEYWKKGKQVKTTKEAMAVTRHFGKGRGRGRFQPHNQGNYHPQNNANFHNPCDLWAQGKQLQLLQQTRSLGSKVTVISNYLMIRFIC